MISKDVEATRGVLLDGIQRVPHSMLLVKELILFAWMHEGGIKVESLDSIVQKALTRASDDSNGLSAKDQEELSILYLEFIDFCGSIHDVKRAWTRHLKLFPHLVRLQSSCKKPVKAGGIWKMLTGGRADGVNSHPQKLFGEDSESRSIQLPPQEGKLHIGEKNDVSEPAKCGAIESTNKAADEREPEVANSTKSNDIQQEQEQEQEHTFQLEKAPSVVDESQNKIASLSPRLEARREVSLSNASTPASVHDIDEIPSISCPVSPRDDNAAERYNESSGPSSKLSHKNALPALSTYRPSDRGRNQHRHNPPVKDQLESGSPRNSEDRVERSLSPRRRGSREYLHDRRYRERSLSPRRHGSRRYSEDRWHRDRHDRRYCRQQDNPRGRRDGRMQILNQPSVGAAVQTSSAQQQIASQAHLPIQPVAFPQAQINQYPLPSNEQYQNAQNNQLYNQMWQYYYYNQQQQQLLLQQQPDQQQQLQQMQPPLQQMQNSSQQQLQNSSQQQQVRNPQQAQPMNPDQQRQLLLQYHQQFYQQQLQQQQPTEQPSSQQQLQSQQQSQEQQQPQAQHEAVQQQQAYQYQELQKQQYLLYLQQLQLYQHSQRPSNLSQDQQSLQPQPGQQDELEKLPELQNGDDKSQHQQDAGLTHVSSHHQMGRGVDSARSTTGAEALAQSQDELPEIEGTDG